MEKQALKAACIQLASGSNVNANLLETEKLVESAAHNGAELVVLPENFAFMGAHCSELLKMRESNVDGPLQYFLSQLARRLGIWLVGGSIPLETVDNSKVRSTCLLFDAEGKRAARYDKVHLFDVNLVEADERYVESEIIEPGNTPCVVDSPFGRLGLAICYDVRFPELFRAMLDQGVEIIVLPAAFTALTGKAHWEFLLHARAIENLSFVLAAAQGGFHINGRETYGHSMIIDPWGNKLAERERGNGYVIADLDLSFLEATRRNFPSISHRRLHCR